MPVGFFSKKHAFFLPLPPFVATVKNRQHALIDIEEAAVGSAGADFEPDGFRAFRTASFVGRPLAIEINAHVNAAAVETDANVTPLVR